MPMKKTLLILPIVFMLAAGCNKTVTQSTSKQDKNEVSTNTAANQNFNRGWTPLPISDWQTYSNSDLGFEVKLPKDWYVSSTEYFYKDKELGVDFISDKNKSVPYTEFIITKNKASVNDLIGYSDYQMPNGLQGKRKLSLNEGQKLQWIYVSNEHYTYLISVEVVAYDCQGTLQGGSTFCDYTPGQQALINTVLSTIKLFN